MIINKWLLTSQREINVEKNDNDNKEEEEEEEENKTKERGFDDVLSAGESKENNRDKNREEKKKNPKRRKEGLILRYSSRLPFIFNHKKR